MGNGDKAGLGTYLQSRPSFCIKKLSGSWFSNLSGNQDLIINRRFKALCGCWPYDGIETEWMFFENWIWRNYTLGEFSPFAESL